MVENEPANGELARLGPASPRSPVILSVPHAGRHYPQELLSQTRIGADRLKLLEDRFVDRLVAPAAERGFTVVVARTARASIDLNRSEREIDPEMIAPPPARSSLETSAKVRGGLGLIPRRLAGHGNIYRAEIDAGDVDRRITEVHRPYHAALSDALDAARRRFGTAVLLDCHSMPPLVARHGNPRPDIVLGDRNGRSAAPGFASRAAAVCRDRGFRVAHNTPYPGGYILARHGSPERDVHALQLEICRSLYLDFALDEPGPGFARIAALIGAIADGLAAEALNGPESLAAE